MPSWRDGPVANKVKHGLKFGLQLMGPRNPLEEISNKIRTRRPKAGKKTENSYLMAESSSRGTNPAANHLLPSGSLIEVGLLRLDLFPTSEDLSMEVDLCQAFSEMLRSSVENLDAEDRTDPQLCSDYVKDIYQYLRQLEMQQPVLPFYLKGTELNGRMRAVLVDWLVEVHARFQLLQETLYMGVAIMDRYLQGQLLCDAMMTGAKEAEFEELLVTVLKEQLVAITQGIVESTTPHAQPVSRKELQLVGVTAMLLAAKYEEIYAPSVLDFVYMTDSAYKAAQVRKMEQSILKELNFDLGRPLPLHFLRRAAKVADPSAESYLLAKYLMELTLVDYEMVHYNPSEIAAAALCLSQKVLSESQWDIKLCYHTGYEERQLWPVMEHMAKNVVRVNTSRTKHMAVKKKYSSTKCLRICTLPQLNSSAIHDLAAPLLGESQPQLSEW